MSQAPNAPTPFETEHGYGPPMCTQFSIFLPNRVGKMYELVEVFDGQPIRVVALSVLDSSDHAVVRIVTTRADQARELLEDHELTFSQAEILVVELCGDQRLTKLCLSLLGAELSIDYIYPMMTRPHGSPTIAIRCDDPVLAGQILRRKGFNIVSEDELRDAAGGDPFVV